MSSNLTKPTKASIAKARSTTPEHHLQHVVVDDSETRRVPRAPMQLIAEDDNSDQEDRKRETEGHQSNSPRVQRSSRPSIRGDIDPTVLAFAEWLSEVQGRSQESRNETEAAVRQYGREAKIQRTAVDLLRRDLNALSSTWHQQFDAVYKALDVASKDISALKKSRNKFENVMATSDMSVGKSSCQTLRDEMASLVEILSGMNREIKMLREERHEEAVGAKEQVEELRKELTELRKEFRDHCNACKGMQDDRRGATISTYGRPISPFQNGERREHSDDRTHDGHSVNLVGITEESKPQRIQQAVPTPRRELSNGGGFVSPRTGNTPVPTYTVPSHSTIDLRSFDGVERAKLVSMSHHPADVLSFSSRSRVVQSPLTPRSHPTSSTQLRVTALSQPSLRITPS